tara:strand:+ start:35 stop:1306 length:1272 start_codon:yes stop_codon:yes gene_type:complete
MNKSIKYKNLSIEQAAKKLKLSQKEVRKLIAIGNIESTKTKGAYKISQNEINSFIKKNKFNKNGQIRLFPEFPIYSKSKNKSQDSVNWMKIDDIWTKKRHSELTFIDLFSGAGGISKGFEMAGLNGIYGLDNYLPAINTYNRNFNHKCFNGDITKSSVKKDFITKVKSKLNNRKLNIVAGGFPCQGFSMSGHRIVADPRNSLYLDMLEIVKKLNPEFVVLENVVGLRSMLKGGVEDKILSDYMEIGYNINVTTLCAADYYVPQKRKRVIFIANNIGLENYHPKPLINENEYRTTKYAIEDLLKAEDDHYINHVKTRHSKDMQRRISKVPEGKSLYENYSDSWKKCAWEEASCTIKENHGGVNLHPKLPRVLTAREMARIQSFPDNFIFEGPKSKQLVQIGNAVPPLLSKAIALSIIKSYEIKK